MLEVAHPVHTELLASTLSWWSEAGVDVLVDDEPRSWLERKPAAVASPATHANAEPLAPRAATIEQLHERLLGLASLDALVPRQQRIAASGHIGSDLMIMIDMPDADDAAEGRLLGGDVAELFERMLAAIGRDRTNCYIAAFCPGRVPASMIASDLSSELVPLARQHIAFAAPKRLWLMGQAVARALIGADAVPGRADLREINHDGGSVKSVASFAPRFLLQRPKMKAAAWRDMQVLMEGL